MVDPKQSLELSQQPSVSMTVESSKAIESSKGSKASAKKGNRKKDKGKSVPRQDSPQARDPRNFTTSRPGQEDWTWTNLPDILYQFEPEDKKDRKSDPPRMSYLIHGQHLRELPILPDNIASTVEEFRVEAWMRLDRRIRLKDITDRMHPDFRIQDNALQQRSVRFRQQFSLIAWDSGNKRSQHLKQDVLQKMEGNGIDPTLNTTRGITPGLIDPSLGEAGGRIPLPKQYNKEKRVARDRKPSKTLMQEEAITNYNAASDVDTPEGPAREASSLAKSTTMEPSAMEPAPVEFALEEFSPIETVSDLYDSVPTFVPFEESNDLPDDPQRIITGLIRDNEQQETTKMENINFNMGTEKPTSWRNTAKTLKSIAPKRIQHNHPSPLKLARGGFCGNACRMRKISTPILANLTRVSGEAEDSLELLPPSHGLYPDVLTPHSEADLPFGVRDQVFDSLFEQCLSGDRYLFDIPAMTTLDLEMMDIGNIYDINIDDFF
ncbi:uncharacterized protein BDW43DRAFT_321954 [Aspergillus alliaceus]|uniref:uncharacterized protein n=1 Tax=Petromyces alliaceus TaxID=209559 RepID=UPI0012A3BA99|nr:uncharacterized protein BDW43DRAFT_321954 [Aspergillus alliaceus]KAB8237645.1 hypothetical protein BDW43DRAFT_321954 [Aspergillus alliaceus]